jgi:hypothetical protein
VCVCIVCVCVCVVSEAPMPACQSQMRAAPLQPGSRERQCCQGCHRTRSACVLCGHTAATERAAAQDAAAAAASARAAVEQRAAELRGVHDSMRAMREECNEHWVSRVCVHACVCVCVCVCVCACVCVCLGGGGVDCTAATWAVAAGAVVCQGRGFGSACVV